MMAVEFSTTVSSSIDTTFFDEKKVKSCGDDKMKTNMCRKRRMLRGGMMLRKSKSEHTLAHEMLLQSVDSLSMHDDQEVVVQEEEEEEQVEEEDKSRRDSIVGKAEEIVQLKRFVGILQVGETCPICLTEDVDTILNPCGHYVHAICIKRWVSQNQRHLNCPICRISIQDIDEAFEQSHVVGMKTLDHSWNFSDTTSSTDECCSTTSGDHHHEEQDGAFEWGWFEDFDTEPDHHPHFYDYLYGSAGLVDSNTVVRPSLEKRPAGTSDLIAPFAQEICKTFSPLNPQMGDILYSNSPFQWVRGLNSSRPIEAKIQIRSFRIVESMVGLHSQHAEYLVELNLDGKYFSRWLRYSSFQQFMTTLPSFRFLKTRNAWKRVEAKSRWFNRLEIDYLHQRCRLLETFAQILLFESVTIHILAELLEAY